MKYFSISHNGNYQARVKSIELTRNDASDIGEEIENILRTSKTPVIIDFRNVKYAHKDCLLYILSAAYGMQRNGEMPIKLKNISQRILKKFQTLVPQETNIY